MKSLAAPVRVAFCTAALVGIASALILAPGAGAIDRKIAYGKVGKMQLVKAQGELAADQKPRVVLPAHTVRPSPLAPTTRQKICTTLEIWTQATAAPFGWTVKAGSGTVCGSVVPGSYAKIGKWTSQAVPSTPYHVDFVVTWATRHKKLAKATYNFNSKGDYKCLVGACLVGTDTKNKVSYIVFTESTA